MSLPRVWTHEYPYHVCNRSIERKNIFPSEKDYARFIRTISFYQYENLPTKLSDYSRLSKISQEFMKQKILLLPKLVDILAYCLMPTHFHILIYPKTDTALTRYMKNTLDSYTKYFNTLYKRKGPIFEGAFRSTQVESDEQLLHLSRYIHLNPYTSYITKSLSENETYPWSSYSTYLSGIKSWVNTDLILGHMNNSSEKYQQFVSDQASFQRQLATMKDPWAN